MSTPTDTISTSISEAVKSAPTADVNQLRRDRATTIREETNRQSALDRAREGRFDREDRELKPLEERTTALERDVAGMRSPELTTDKVKWEPKPIVDPGDYQKFSMAMIGMALIGGVISRGNWLGTSAVLNGALKGYLEGDQQKADKAFQDYQTKFNEALEHDKRMQKEFEDILRSKTMTINSMLREMQNVAAKYGREDMRAEAQQRSIDGLWRQVEAYDRAIQSAEEQNFRISATIGMGVARMKAVMGGAAIEALDTNGRWFLDQTFIGGNDKYLKELQSRYGGAVAAQAMNDIGKILRDEGIDPRTMTESQIDNQVQLSAQRMANNRLLAVERLTGSITQIEGRVQSLVADVNGRGVRAVNKSLNDLASQFGDEQVAELRTLLAGFGRQYFEALTMPGSNAQMHASAQDVADALADPNAPIGTIQGVLKGANFEIKSTTDALRAQIKESKGIVLGQGPTLTPSPTGTGAPVVARPSPGGAPSATVPQPPVPGATPAQ
jgi:hypothetical protein